MIDVYCRWVWLLFVHIFLLVKGRQKCLLFT
nr:MAG TPA: Scavenger receptor class B member-BI, transmembrane domain, cholesterol, SIGNALING [Caudoviricetes sp.]